MEKSRIDMDKIRRYEKASRERNTAECLRVYATMTAAEKNYMAEPILPDECGAGNLGACDAEFL